MVEWSKASVRKPTLPVKGSILGHYVVFVIVTAMMYLVGGRLGIA